MKVSVLIPAYNAEKTIEHAIRSAQNQSRPPDEIIVANDGSADGTSACAGRAGATVLDLPRGNGSIARNQAAKQASGDLFFFLDADDWWLEDKIANHLAAWEQATRSTVFDPSIRVSLAGNEGSTMGRGPDGDVPWQDFLERRNWAGGSSFSVTRANYFGIGGFNESLKRLQDVDFLVRCAERFGPARRINPSCTKYLVSASGVSRSTRVDDDAIRTALAGWPFASARQKAKFRSLIYICFVDVTPFPQSLSSWWEARSRWYEPRFWQALIRSIKVSQAVSRQQS